MKAGAVAGGAGGAGAAADATAAAAAATAAGNIATMPDEVITLPLDQLSDLASLGGVARAEPHSVLTRGLTKASGFNSLITLN